MSKEEKQIKEITDNDLDAGRGLVTENYQLEILTLKDKVDLRRFSRAFLKVDKLLKNIFSNKLDKGEYGGSAQDLKNEIDGKLNHTNGYGKNIGIDKYRKVIPNATLMNPQGDNSVLDTIAVHLPSGWNSSMLAFDLKVRAYNIQSANLTISFTGYPFGGNKAWHGVHVKVSGGTYEGKIRAFTTTHPSSGNPLIYFNFPNKFDYLNCGIFNVLESVATEYEIYAIQGSAGDEVPVVYEYSTTHKPDELRVSRNITIGNVTKQFNGGNDLNYTYEELRLLSKDKDEIMNGSLSINTILNVRDANGTHSMLMTAQGGITWLQGGATGLSQKMEITGLNASNLETLTLRANEVKFNGLLNMKSGSSVKYPNNMVQYSDEYAVGFMDATNGTWKIKANKAGGVDMYGNSSTTGVHTIYSDHNALTLTGRTGASPLYILARDSGGSHLWDIGKLNSVNDLYIENLVYGTQLVLGQNDFRFNKMILEHGQRVYSPNNKPTPQSLGCFPYNTIFSGSIPKTFIGACQVSNNSPDYGNVGGGSQHFLIQMTTESGNEGNAYVGQIGFGYNPNSPSIGIRAKTPSGDGAWHLAAMKREFSMVALNGYHKHIDASGKITLYFEITLAPNEVRTINFPEAFPNTCFSIVSCGKVNSASRGTSVTCGCVPINKYGFSAQGMYANSNLTYMIVAEGY